MWSPPGPKRIWTSRLPRLTSLTLNLLPLTVIQLSLVCFLLQIARATGETYPPPPPRPDIKLPRAANGDELLLGPLVEISLTEMWIDGSVVADGAELADKLLV